MRDGPGTHGVILVFVVLLAGCNAAVGDNDVTVTPAPIPQTGTGTDPVIEDLIDGEFLAHQLTETLSNQSYTVRATETQRYVNGSLHRFIALELRIEPGGTFTVEITVDGPQAQVFNDPPATAAYWSNGEQYIEAITRNNETTYFTAAKLDPYNVREGHQASSVYWLGIVAPGGQPNEDIKPLFNSINTDVTGEIDDTGPQLYRLTSSHLTDPQRFAETEDVSIPEDVELTALVNEDGVMQRYALSYSATLEGERIHVNRTVEYNDVGRTEVEPPIQQSQ